jgi:D-hydroxyproline dehydrogenase subunit beta
VAGEQRYDLAVVGSGIVGLGHAAAAVERGLRVVVIDRATAITGSSIRNFGQIGTSVHTGAAAEYAGLSRDIWLRLAERAGFWARETGSVLVARAADELAVLEEAGLGEVLTASQVTDLVPVVGAVGGMRRTRDLQVDPREAAPAIARYLEAQGVEFRWRTSAVGVTPGTLHTARGDISADAIVFAVNFDVDQLFPDIAEALGVERCGLDMLLADGVGLRIPVLTGTSMLRYRAFADTRAAAAVRERYAREAPELFERDVNQMYTERPDGTLLVGDTHYRGTAIAPFQDEEAFELLLRLSADLFGRPLRVRQRWQGVYASAPEPFLIATPGDGIRVVSVTTGIGMTTGLGLAATVIDDLFGSTPGGTT